MLSAPGWRFAVSGPPASSAISSTSVPGSFGRTAAATRTGQLLEPVHEICEKAQRRVIDPVEVVDRQEHRLVAGQVEGEPVERVQDAEAVDRQLTAGALKDRPRPGGRAGERALARARGRAAPVRTAGARRRTRTRARSSCPVPRARARRRTRRSAAPHPAGSSFRCRRVPRSGRAERLDERRRLRTRREPDLALALQQHGAMLVSRRRSSAIGGGAWPFFGPLPGFSPFLAPPAVSAPGRWPRARGRAWPVPGRAGRRRTSCAPVAAGSPPPLSPRPGRRSRGCRARSCRWPCRRSLATPRRRARGSGSPRRSCRPRPASSPDR